MLLYIPKENQGRILWGQGWRGGNEGRRKGVSCKEQRPNGGWLRPEKIPPPPQGVRHTIPFTGMGGPDTPAMRGHHGLREALLMPQDAGELGTRELNAGREGGREPPGTSERAMSTGRGRITPESAYGKGCALHTRRKMEQPTRGKQV